MVRKDQSRAKGGNRLVREDARGASLKFDLVRAKCQQAEWEDATRRLFPASDQLGLLRSTGIDVNTAWGWKIHLSCTAGTAREVVARLNSVAYIERFAAKAPARFRDIAAINAGLFGYAQIGKIFTFYGPDAGLVDLGASLTRQLADFVGPIVPFEKRLPGSGCLFYRYGRYKPSPGEDDDAQTAGLPPEGVIDPFGGSKSTTRRIFATTPIFACLSQRAKGGAYLALELEQGPARQIVLKEGRRLGEVEQTGVDGYAFVLNEERHLRRLMDTGVAPKVLRRTTTDDAVYLHLEYVVGRSLSTLLGARSLDLRRQTTIARSLARNIARLHRRGCVWGDCKPDNVIVDPRYRTKLLDFEGARLIGEPQQGAMRTAPFAEPAGEWMRRDGRPADVFALGKTFSLLFGFEPQYQRLRSGAREDALRRLVRCMTAFEAHRRPRIDEIVRHLDVIARLVRVGRGQRRLAANPRFLRTGGSRRHRLNGHSAP